MAFPRKDIDTFTDLLICSRKADVKAICTGKLRSLSGAWDYFVRREARIWRTPFIRERLHSSRGVLDVQDDYQIDCCTFRMYSESIIIERKGIYFCYFWTMLTIRDVIIYKIIALFRTIVICPVHLNVIACWICSVFL